MKLATYRVDGKETFGIVTDSGVIDAQALLGPRADSLRSALTAGLLGELGELAADRAVDHELNEIELLPPIPDASKILCVGVNYVDHREESGITDLPEYPTIFTRFSDTHVGHGAPIVRPACTEKLDYEGEVALVIGKHIGTDSLTTDEDAIAAIAGLSCYNDVSVRDWQLHTSQWIPGKNFHEVGSFGPTLVTLDEFDDLDSVRLVTRVNGDEVQNATLGQLIFGFAAILRYITGFTPLVPGDVVVTGTPGGVGMVATPPRFLQPGDTVEVEATGLGVLSNRIDAAAR